MIELIFLFVIIPRRIKALAKERGESTLKWSLAAIGAWIGAEIVAGAILGFTWGIISEIGLVPQGNVVMIFYILYYVLVITAAAMGATLVIQTLRRKPILLKS